MQVEVTPVADSLYGLIQREHRGDSEALAAFRTAYYAIIFELRGGHPSIWFMSSDLELDAYSLNHPPLIAHFRTINAQKVAIFAFEFIESELR